VANDLARAEFWKEFVASRCDYPNPDRLREQLFGADFADFCYCGCNSFAVKVRTDVEPLSRPLERSSDGHGAIYTADFKLTDERTLEIVLFADGAGNLDYIEVDCCANSYPVPDDIEVEGPPFHTWSAKSLIC